MLDIPKIYENPILYRERLGTAIMPFRKIKESMTVTQEGYVLLTEVPNKNDRVKVTGLNREFHEVEDDFLKESYFKVDYINGWVFFHESLIGKTLNFEYTGKGVFLIPDSRVYHTGENSFPTVKDKFIDVDRAILVERNRITEQIVSHPQPSELVDARVDYNGKIFDITKHRIDAEQKKIEEAYYDAKGKRYDSLKLRIDSLQLATESSFDDQHEVNTNLWASIDLIPGKIELEAGKLEKKINGEIELLKSQISLVPEQIKLSVEKLSQSVDGEISAMMSLIDMQADMIDMKVDVNGVTSAINLSKDGVRIQGNKLWLNGETRIDNAVIKSAHIASIDASKIKTGTLEALSIKSSTISGSLIRGTNIYVNGDMPEFLYSNAIDTNPETKGVHIYIRPTADGEVRTTRTHTRDRYVPIRTLGIKSPSERNMYIGTDGELRVKNHGFTGAFRNVRANVYYGAAIDANAHTEVVNMYVRPAPSGEVRITRRGTTDRYAPIAASAFRIRSSKTSKENIIPTRKKGLDIIRGLDVVEYNYIDEPEKSIGVIAEDSPEIADKDREFVNLNDLVMYLLLSIKELDKEVKQLRGV